MSTLKKGSNWIKCDLHVHTPSSFFHQYGDAQQPKTWEKFISDLEKLPEEFKMLGINDYLTLDGYKRVLDFKNKGRLANIECILPVIEFRINRFAGEKKLSRINFHVIFSDKIDVKTIQSQFINSIASSYTLESGSSEPDWSASPTDDSLEELGKKIKSQSPGNTTLQNESDWQVGFNNFNVDYEKLKEILKRPAFRDRTIKAIGKGEWDDFRWDAGGAADKRTIINEADIVFLASKNPQHYLASRDKLKADNVNDFLLDCSDAHYFSDSSENIRIGNCNTWLKIEPTFNGLKQVLFEQDDRVYIGETHPDTKSPYQVIKYVEFAGKGNYFATAPIELSSGLNSIIGGKSTGKSLLAGLIVKSCDLNEYNKRKSHDQKNDLDWIYDKQSGVDFNVHWKDGEITSLSNTTKSRKVTYFPQHYLNSKINDKNVENKELNRLIRNILSQTPSVYDAFNKYEDRVKELDSRIAVDSSLFETKLRDLHNLLQSLGEKGKSKDIKSNIERLNKELSELKNKYDLTQDDLQRHQEIIETLKDIARKKQQHLEDISAIQKVDSTRIEQAIDISSVFEDQLNGLGEEVKAEMVVKTSGITKEYAIKIHAVITQILSSQKDKISELDAKASIKEIEHQPILSKIRNFTPLREKNELIQTESEKLDEVTRLESNVTMINVEIDEIINRLTHYIDNKIEQSGIVTEAIFGLALADADNQLEVNIEHKCKSANIQHVLKDRAKYQSNQDIRLYVNEVDFDDNHIDRYVARVQTLLEQSRNNILELKGDNKLSNIIQEVLSNAIYLNYDLKLGGDSFNIMSPGKRALALLRVLVELDQSQHPIILDQPEDDLDNRSVYEGLATYLKKKKKDRQIIVVTHNPNVVVGADSEHVIVANQSGQESNRDNRTCQFEYVYGGLEDSFEQEGNSYILEKKGIREHVCEILDGGEKAFERRERLYSGFQKELRSIE